MRPQAFPVAANLTRGVVPRNSRNAATRVGRGTTQVQARYRGAIVCPVRCGTLPEQLVCRELTVEYVSLRQTHDRLEIRRHQSLDVDDPRRESRRHRVEHIERSL